MTFLPSQVIGNDEWRKRHRGHRTREVVEDVSIKRMHWLVCDDCGSRHLNRMETIAEQSDGPVDHRNVD
jgi:hypothetical protein